MAERTLTVKILGDSTSLRREFDRSAKSAQGFQAQVVGLRGTALRAGAAVGLAFGGTEVVRQAFAATQAASNLNEEINKAQVVFGKSADEIIRWSRTTANSFGISQRAALAAAGGFGQMLETAGLTETAAAGMSRRLVELAGDMSSFNNISTDEALLKLRSGLAGEAEPLRVLGVQLSENAVKLEAYRSGIAKSGAQLTEAQKVQARFNLIFAQTTRQQGDAGRTIGNLAGQQRVLIARTEELQAQLGKRLVPVLNTVIGALLQGESAAEGFGTALQKLGRTKIPGGPFGGGSTLGGAAGLLKKEIEINFKYLNPIGQAVTIGNFLFGKLRDKPKVATIQIEFDTSKLVLPPSVARVPRIFEPGFKPGGAPPVPVIPPEQINRIFDEKIARELFRSADKTLPEQIKALDRIEAQLTAEIARVKDITRKQNLRDQLIAAQRQERALREQIAANALEAKRLAAEKRAEALERLRDAIQRRRERAAAAAAARLAANRARQFRALGLTREGDEPVAGVRSLRKQVTGLEKAVEGTFLDTRKTDNLMKRIRKVLSGGLGAVGRDVRSKIQQILADLRQQLKQHTDTATRFHKANANAILAGAGLSPEQIRLLRSRLSQVGAGGLVHGTGVGAFGIPLTVTLNHTTELDGRVLERSTTKHQQKRRRRNPQQKRGAVSP